ncbi:MAG: aminoacyl-tRNA hydrolase [Clostridia bacterium]|nr:aminoacyl-tRNA hydrolase [Clostridia bacterium]
MYLIVGLGNPEADYDKTRHNMGFHVINELAKEYEIELNRKNFNGIYGNGIIEGQKVILLKPQTYMNLSGESIVEYKNFYKIEPENMIIVYDDIDLEPGEIRIRRKGSAGSHNGMKSVIQCINSEDFPRVRVGIGKPGEEKELIQHVIGAVDEQEWELLNEGTKKAKDAIIQIIKDGIDKAMNKYN